MRLYNQDVHRNTSNYQLLLFSFAALLLFPIIGQIWHWTNFLFFYILYSLVIVFGIYTATKSMKELLVGIVLGSMTLTSMWGHQIIEFPNFYFKIGEILVSISFFVFLGIHILKDLVSKGLVNSNTIYGVILGYILIGMIGGQLCILIDHLIPDSFGNYNPDQSKYQYYYYSFVTMTTLGYGDIYPLNDASRSISILITTVGQIYITIVIAIIIGKYLRNSES